MSIRMNIDDPNSTFIIELSSNGFIINYFDDENRKSVLSLLEHDTGSGEYWNEIRSFLYNLLEVIGIYNSKHYSKRITIDVIDNQ